MRAQYDHGARARRFDGALAARSDYTEGMRRRRSPVRPAVTFAAAFAVGLGGAGLATGRARAQTAQPVGAAASSSASASSSATSAPTAARPRHRSEEESIEVELIDLTEGAEPDPQALAIGLSGGGAVFHTRGSVGVSAAADFAFTFDVGLGPGGARAPWSLEGFAAFAITRASLASDVQVFPDRWTELGARIVYRGAPGSGLLDGRWLSLGFGGVWTSWGSCEAGSDLVVVDPLTGPQCTSRHELAPAGLVDVGVGVQEWSTRFARYGLGVRAPFELSSHWGWGAVAFFYAQIGLGR